MNKNIMIVIVVLIVVIALTIMLIVKLRANKEASKYSLASNAIALKGQQVQAKSNFADSVQAIGGLVGNAGEIVKSFKK